MRGRPRDDDHRLLMDLRVEVGALTATVDGLDKLTEEKFVKYGAMLSANAKEVALALASADKAVTKAEVATERRFEGVNEFRAQLSDQASRFLNREQYEAAHRPLAERIAELVAERGTLVRREFLDAVLESQERNAANSRAADLALIDKLANDVRTLQTSAANMQGRFWALGVGLGLVVVAVNVLLKFLG